MDQRNTPSGDAYFMVGYEDSPDFFIARSRDEVRAGFLYLIWGGAGQDADEVAAELDSYMEAWDDTDQYWSIDKHHFSMSFEIGGVEAWRAPSTLLAMQSDSTRRLNQAILPSLPGQKELTVTMVKDDGDVQADAAIEAVKAGTSTFHITNPSPLFFHHLRLRVALEPKLDDRIAVYYLMPDTREWRAVGLSKDDELRWPPGFELGLWEKESQISAVRAGDAAKGQAAEVANELRRKYGC